MHGYALRTAGAVAAPGMAVTLGLSVTLSQTTIMQARADESRQGLRDLVSVTAPSLGGIPDGLLAQVAAASGVEATALTRTTTVLTRSLLFGDDPGLVARSALVLGPDAHGVVDLGIVAGSLRQLEGPTIALDERAGRVGERRELVMGDGAKVRAKVVATYRRALGFGPVVVARDLAAGHTTTDLPTTILVRQAGSSLDRVLARWPGARVSDSAVAAQAASAEALVNVAVLAVLLGYLLVSVANRLVATTTARKRELDSLRRLGATPGQLRAMIRWEASMIAAGAAGSGLVLSAIPLVMLSTGFLGRPWPAGPLWLVPAAVTKVGVVVWLAQGLPARRMIRQHVHPPGGHPARA